MAETELPESWTRVAETLRVLIAELERDAHADGAAPDLATLSARWIQLRDAIRATARARIVSAQAAQALAPTL